MCWMFCKNLLLRDSRYYQNNGYIVQVTYSNIVHFSQPALCTPEELVLNARSQRGRCCLGDAFMIIERLAYALKELDSSTFEDRVRSKVLYRLLMKELGIWCYLVFLQGARKEYLAQAQTCLEAVYEQCGADAELVQYCAFALWHKWQSKQATMREVVRCATLLRVCTQEFASEITQLGVAWFRLGCLYQLGIGMANTNKIDTNQAAQYCFDQARASGFDC